MVKEPAGTRIITPPAELVKSEVGDFSMTRPLRFLLTPALTHAATLRR